MSHIRPIFLPNLYLEHVASIISDERTFKLLGSMWTNNERSKSRLIQRFFSSSMPYFIRNLFKCLIISESNAISPRADIILTQIDPYPEFTQFYPRADRILPSAYQNLQKFHLIPSQAQTNPFFTRSHPISHWNNRILPKVRPISPSPHPILSRANPISSQTHLTLLNHAVIPLVSQFYLIFTQFNPKPSRFPP